jgi:hypothetical protein
MPRRAQPVSDGSEGLLSGEESDIALSPLDPGLLHREHESGRWGCARWKNVNVHIAKIDAGKLESD